MSAMAGLPCGVLDGFLPLLHPKSLNLRLKLFLCIPILLHWTLCLCVLTLLRGWLFRGLLGSITLTSGSQVRVTVCTSFPYGALDMVPVGFSRVMTLRESRVIGRQSLPRASPLGPLPIRRFTCYARSLDMGPGTAVVRVPVCIPGANGLSALLTCFVCPNACVCAQGWIVCFGLCQGPSNRNHVRFGH